MKLKLNNAVVLSYVLVEKEWRNVSMPREMMFQVIANAELMCKVANTLLSLK